MTSPGITMGTIAYMSPEQARGEELDARTDLFSFGAVLYEMATGRMAFPGNSAAVIYEAILNRTSIPASQINKALPPKLDEIIGKAIEKDRKLRYQSAADIRADLQRLKRDTESARLPAATSAAVGVRKRRTIWWKVIVSAGAAVVVLAAGSYFYFHRTPKLTDKDTIVIADFSNSTGDAVFDDTLRTALSVSLNQSPFLNVLPDNRVAATLKLMMRPTNSRLTPEVVRDLCQRAGSKAYIDGSVARLGSQYVLGLKAVNCQSGDTLAQEQVTAAAKEKVLDATGQAAARLRGELGESLVSVQKFNMPLAEATTSSLEALQAYTLGRKAAQEKTFDAVLPYFQKAIQIDPNFAMGYADLGNQYFGIGEEERASVYTAKAFELREHASEREKLKITGDYYFDVTGQQDKAVQAYQEYIENYPLLGEAYLDLAFSYAALGQYEKAAESCRQGIRRDPDHGSLYVGLAIILLPLHQFDEARANIQRAQLRKFGNYSLHDVLYRVSFLGSDSTAMAEEQKWFAGDPDYTHYGLSLASDTEAFYGRLTDARALTRRSVESATNLSKKENGAKSLENSALREVAFGNPTRAKQAAADGLKLAPTNQGVAVEAALAYAMAGDAGRAESQAQELDKRYPVDTLMQSLWLPAIRAQLALDRRNPPAAIDSLQRAMPPIEYGWTPFGTTCLYPTYIRGEAYLAAGQGGAAASEFQKILDHSGTVSNCWTGALAHLGVARANALQTKTSQGADAVAARVRALAAYNDFLTLWKNADPDIPILIAAKSEYAKLK